LTRSESFEVALFDQSLISSVVKIDDQVSRAA